MSSPQVSSPHHLCLFWPLWEGPVGMGQKGRSWALSPKATPGRGALETRVCEQQVHGPLPLEQPPYRWHSRVSQAPLASRETGTGWSQPLRGASGPKTGIPGWSVGGEGGRGSPGLGSATWGGCVQGAHATPHKPTGPSAALGGVQPGLRPAAVGAAGVGVHSD